MPRPFTDGERERILQSLLQAGRNSVARVGFRRTRIEDVAREAGISKGAFYLFFPRKEDLLMAVMREAEATLRAQLDATTDLQSALRIVFRAMGSHPMLAPLADPQDFAWLARAMPEGTLQEAQADDDRYFRALFTRLVGDHPDLDALVRIPTAALAIAQQASLLGDRYEAVCELLVASLCARFG